MKPGARTLGIAESYRTETSTLAGCVVRASRVVDGFVFGTCTVGGHDATDAVCEMFTRLDREDLQYCFISGTAPAWFNVLDLGRIYEESALPVLSVTFDESPGLEEAIRDAFDEESGVERRIATYRNQPVRHRISVNGERVFVRCVGIDERDVADVVRAFTPEGGHPEPLRVARMAARAVESFSRT